MGLDYGILEDVAGWLDIEINTGLFRKIRMLEAETLNRFYGDKNKTDRHDVKGCRNADACAMCNKHCGSRIGNKHGR